MIHNKKYKNIKEAFDFNDAYNEPEVDDISNEVSGYLGPESLIDFVKQNLHSVTWEILENTKENQHYFSVVFKDEDISAKLVLHINRDNRTFLIHFLSNYSSYLKQLTINYGKIVHYLISLEYEPVAVGNFTHIYVDDVNDVYKHIKNYAKLLQNNDINPDKVILVGKENLSYTEAMQIKSIFEKELSDIANLTIAVAPFNLRLLYAYDKIKLYNAVYENDSIFLPPFADMTEEEAKDILDSHDIIIPSDNQIVKCLAKVNTTSERKQTLINAMVRDSNMQFIWKKLLYAVCFYICFRSNYEYLVKLYSTDWKNTILKGILDEIDLSIKLVDIKSVEELIIAMYIYVVSRLQ